MLGQNERYSIALYGLPLLWILAKRKKLWLFMVPYMDWLSVLNFFGFESICFKPYEHRSVVLCLRNTCCSKQLILLGAFWILIDGKVIWCALYFGFFMDVLIWYFFFMCRLEGGRLIPYGIGKVGLAFLFCLSAQESLLLDKIIYRI